MFSCIIITYPHAFVYFVYSCRKNVQLPKPSLFADIYIITHQPQRPTQNSLTAYSRNTFPKYNNPPFHKIISPYNNIIIKQNNNHSARLFIKHVPHHARVPIVRTYITTATRIFQGLTRELNPGKYLSARNEQ